jgi:hypothetical protein
MFEAYDAAKERLQLERLPDDEGLFTTTILLSGVVDGYDVLVRRVVGADQRLTRAMLRRPADLGLLVTRAGALHALFGEKVGSAPFDAAFTVRADEPARAVALLGERLRERLLRWHVRGIVLAVCDEFVEISTSSRNDEAETADAIEADVRAVAALAPLVDAAMESVPPAEPLRAHLPVWSEYSRAHRLDLSRTPLRMSGRLGSSDVVVRAVRSGNLQFGAEIEVRFGAPLDAPLRVWRRETERFFEPPSDEAPQRTGDAAFDARFQVVSARDEVGEDLDARVRGQLLALGDHDDEVTLTQDALVVRAARLAAPAEVIATVDRAADVAKRFYDRARHPSPYR